MEALRSSGYAIFVDDAVLQRVLYCVCACVWTQEEVRSVTQFLWAKGTAPIEIHHEIQAVYGPNVMTVQHVRKCCREFSGCCVSVTDEQRSRCPSTSADLVPAIEDTVRANRQVLLKGWKNSLIFHMGQSGTLFINV